MIEPYHSPLRYPGGKGKVLNFVRLLFHENRLVGRDYIEPYAGGGAVALGLLFHDYVSNIWINDIDPAIYSFWKSIIERTDDFVELIKITEITVDEWHRQRTILGNSESDELKLGFACFYLNRTNRSGIVSGGLIGGRNQDGPYKMDARFDKEKLIKRIERISSLKDRIKVTGLDTKNLLKDYHSWSDRPFFYLDPPYVGKGADLYRNFYKESDHREIGQLVMNLNDPWVISYDNVSLVREIYKNYPELTYDLSYSAMDRKKGGEIMFFSKALAIPSVSSPACLPHKAVWRHEQPKLITT